MILEIGKLYVNDKYKTSGTLVVLCTRSISDIAFSGVVVELGSYDKGCGYEIGQYKTNFAKNAFLSLNKKLI